MKKYNSKLKNFIFFTPVVFLFCLFPSLVFAAPSISGVSGTLSHGSQITITGSAFGTKSPAAPVKWDDFNSGTNGNQLSSTIWTTQTAIGSGDVVYPKYSNSVLRTNDTMSCKIFMGASTGQWNCAFGYDGTGNRYWYISYWRYDIAGAADNYKHFRIYGNGDGDDPQVSYTELSAETSLFGVWDEPGEDEQCTRWTGNVGTRNAWTREEFYIYAGTRGNSDGSAKFWKNASLLTSFSFGYPALNSGYSGELDRPRIGHYWNSGAGDITSYFSEAYIDNTQARVEIGDANTWAGCTHREIQIPSAWSTNSITFTANQGSFSDGQQAYLYIVDSTGAVNSAGYPITIGSGQEPDTTPPTPPSGVTIQ
jgi:hypothetical protein